MRRKFELEYFSHKNWNHENASNNKILVNYRERVKNDKLSDETNHFNKHA
jgi:hypothetical protein